MAAEAKERLGRIACPVCGHASVLRRNALGTISLACDECDVSLFAKKGTAAAVALAGKVPAHAGSSNEPPATESKSAAQSKPKAGFSLGGLR